MKKPFVTVHTITYNEEVVIESFINHYRNIFPECIIKIYDNYSTDNTVKIAESKGCIVDYYNSDGYLDDSKFLEIKNNCWKTAETDWVVVCDADEHIQITQDELKLEESIGYNIINFIGYTMMNKNEYIPIEKMKYGYRDKSFDKYYLFNKNHISEINYNFGCHRENGFAPSTKNNIPLSIGSSKEYKALHYKYLGLEYSKMRRDMMSKRISEFNRSKKFTMEYVLTEDQLKKDTTYNHLSIERIYSETNVELINKSI